jgi:Domain of unknown function (DUF6285)
MQDRPNIKELVLAVREFLETEIAPALSDPRLKFRTLVAMNALGMIARESELEEALLRQEYAGLSELLEMSSVVPQAFTDLKTDLLEANVKLANLIRSGQIPAGAFDHLEQSIRAKLEVSHPAFLNKFQ